MDNNSNLEQNQLQREYLSANLNEVWTINVTTIKRVYYWFFVIDLASKRIAEHDLTAIKAVHVLQMAINLEKSIYPEKPVRMFILI